MVHLLMQEPVIVTTTSIFVVNGMCWHVVVNHMLLQLLHISLSSCVQLLHISLSILKSVLHTLAIM